MRRRILKIRDSSDRHKGKEEPTSAGGGTVTYVLDKCAKEFLE
jgi:hypothetical protein